MRRIAVKVGSNVLTRQDGTLDITRMSAIVDQIAELYKRGIQVILVSSGAVASGRSEITPSHTLDEVSSRQLYSAIGQAKLMGKYYTLFREHGITCGQVLTTKEGLDKSDHYLNQQHCMEVMLGEGVIPIVNENDTLSITELMFTDNDELSGLMAEMMKVDELIILSNIDGIYDGNPADPNSSVIRKVATTDNMEQYIQTGKSTLGRGGMLTKCHIARKVASEGIPVVIANGRSEDILLRLIDQPEETICTRFL
jgi:glutamate 5-kinase